MSTHDLEDMGCGTSSSTKDRKSEKGECQWEVGGARFLDRPRESEPASPSPLSRGSHSLLQPPRALVHKVPSLQLKAECWQNAGNYL